MKKIYLEDNMPLIKGLEADGRFFDTIEAANTLAAFYSADDEDAEVVKILHWDFNEYDEVVPYTFGYGVVLWG